MITRNVSWLVGALFLVMSGAALAHQSARYDGYPADWSGSVTVYAGAYGPAGWSGSLSYGSPYVYAPGFIPWAAIPAGHLHNARCNHGPRHGYQDAYRRGYNQGHHDDHRHRGKHGHRGHGRGYDD